MTNCHPLHHIDVCYFESLTNNPIGSFIAFKHLSKTFNIKKKNKESKKPVLTPWKPLLLTRLKILTHFTKQLHALFLLPSLGLSASEKLTIKSWKCFDFLNLLCPFFFAFLLCFSKWRSPRKTAMKNYEESFSIQFLAAVCGAVYFS